MMDFINNIFFWIITTFSMVALLIVMFIILILIKMKTNAMIELKAFFKKEPVNIFLNDGKFLEMKVCKSDAGVVQDDVYGLFILNEKCSYLGKTTRNVYNLFDTSFAPGINLKAAETAQVLRTVLGNDEDFYDLQKRIADGTLDDERLNAIKTNVNVSSLKQLYNCIEPHNIHASVEKKVAKQIKSMGSANNGQILLTFMAIFGAIIGGYILLKIFNTG